LGTNSLWPPQRAIRREAILFCFGFSVIVSFFLLSFFYIQTIYRQDHWGLLYQTRVPSDHLFNCAHLTDARGNTGRVVSKAEMDDVSRLEIDEVKGGLFIQPDHSRSLPSIV